MHYAFMLAAVLTQMTPLPSPAPTPNVPVYFGNPAVRMAVDARALGFDPDGNARWLVVTKFFDAQNKPTRIIANSDFTYRSSDGYVQWQTRLAYGQPSAILSTTVDGALTMTVVANEPRIGSVTVRTNTRSWRSPRAVAKALGPHLVQIGWFPREAGEVRIFRAEEGGARRLLALIAGPSSTFRDTNAEPGRSYQYVVERTGHEPARLAVTTPQTAPATPIDNVRGKGMWLYFTSNPVDAIYFKHLDPGAIVAQAVRAGLHYVELRTSYGAYWEITPEAKPTDRCHNRRTCGARHQDDSMGGAARREFRGCANGRARCVLSNGERNAAGRPRARRGARRRFYGRRAARAERAVALR